MGRPERNRHSSASIAASSLRRAYLDGACASPAATLPSWSSFTGSWRIRRSAPQVGQDLTGFPTAWTGHHPAPHAWPATARIIPADTAPTGPMAPQWSIPFTGQCRKARLTPGAGPLLANQPGSSLFGWLPLPGGSKGSGWPLVARHNSLCAVPRPHFHGSVQGSRGQPDAGAA